MTNNQQIQECWVAIMIFSTILEHHYWKVSIRLKLQLQLLQVSLIKLFLITPDLKKYTRIADFNGQAGCYVLFCFTLWSALSLEFLEVIDIGGTSHYKKFPTWQLLYINSSVHQLHFNDYCTKITWNLWS